MKRTLPFLLALLILILLGIQCEDAEPTTVKFAIDDPFQETMAASQIFEIDAKLDNVVEGEQGTVIAIPKGCFVNAQGKEITSKVRVELTEALTLDRMLLSNLTTSNNRQNLETGGMIYFNATANGEQVYISEEHPVRIEIPTDEKKPGMMVFKGFRDGDGNMEWTNPQELDQSLVPIPLDQLDLLPEGFRSEVENGLPFRGHTEATQQLIDSLYFSLFEPPVIEETPSNAPRETHYGAADNDVDTSLIDSLLNEAGALDTLWGNYATCGVSPSIIQTIKSDKFENTLIATREFEIRLRYMFQICRPDIIEIYIRNLDKNFWELDSLVTDVLGDDNYHDRFYDFYRQKRTRVLGSNVNAELLKTYYEARLQEVRSELKAARARAVNASKEKTADARGAVQEYEELLRKREKYRMETYGFELSETG